MLCFTIIWHWSGSVEACFENLDRDFDIESKQNMLRHRGAYANLLYEAQTRFRSHDCVPCLPVVELYLPLHCHIILTRFSLPVALCDIRRAANAVLTEHVFKRRHARRCLFSVSVYTVCVRIRTCHANSKRPRAHCGMKFLGRIFISTALRGTVFQAGQRMPLVVGALRSLVYSPVSSTL